MADTPAPSRTKWIWVALLVAFTALALVMIFNPTGDRDGDVDDPIASEAFGTNERVPPGETTDAPAPEPFAPGGDPD